MLRYAVASWHIGPASADPVFMCFLHSKSDLVCCACSFTLFTNLFVCHIMGLKKIRAKDSGE